ncbi:MAG: hypothetical protein PSV35_02360, partial [bacterium]|nr:hypothetical protein [bacterium]
QGSTICIAAGKYNNATKGFPLIALSQDSGVSWSFPVEMGKSLPKDLSEGEFQAAGATLKGNSLLEINKSN